MRRLKYNAKNGEMKKYILGVGAAAAGALLPLVAAAQVSTSTIATRVDTMTATLFDYFDLAILKFWPIVLGFALLIAVYLIGRKVYYALTTH